MSRFITQHWPTIGILGTLYLLAFASLGMFTSVQIDAMQNQVQFVGERAGKAR
jgi:hypothetical protein